MAEDGKHSVSNSPGVADPAAATTCVQTRSMQRMSAHVANRSLGKFHARKVRLSTEHAHEKNFTSSLDSEMRSCAFPQCVFTDCKPDNYSFQWWFIKAPLPPELQ